MIQRPQTVFLLAVVAICIMLIFSDLVYYKTQNSDKTESVNVEYDETEIIASDGTSKNQNTVIVYLLSGIGILALISIFLFRNRKLQVQLSAFNFVFILALVIMMYLGSYGVDYFKNGTEVLTFYALIPLALLFFNFLAMRSVKKDENLIRSMDRLR
jgi:hypothetical protein